MACPCSSRWMVAAVGVMTGSDHSEPIEVRHRPFDDGALDKARELFDLNHENSYHELCGLVDTLRAALVAERALSDALAAACAEYMTVELAIAKHEGCKAQRPCPECDDLGEALQDAEGNARDALTAWRSARAGLT